MFSPPALPPGAAPPAAPERWSALREELGKAKDFAGIASVMAKYELVPKNVPFLPNQVLGTRKDGRNNEAEGSLLSSEKDMSCPICNMRITSKTGFLSHLSKFALGDQFDIVNRYKHGVLRGMFDHGFLRFHDIETYILTNRRNFMKAISSQTVNESCCNTNNTLKQQNRHGKNILRSIDVTSQNKLLKEGLRAFQTSPETKDLDHKESVDNNIKEPTSQTRDIQDNTEDTNQEKSQTLTTNKEKLQPSTTDAELEENSQNEQVQENEGKQLTDEEKEKHFSESDPFTEAEEPTDVDKINGNDQKMLRLIQLKVRIHLLLFLNAFVEGHFQGKRY